MSRAKALDGPPIVNCRADEVVEVNLSLCRRLYEEDVAALRECTTLEKLTITNELCKGDWLVHLKHLSHLTYLDLSDTSIDDRGLANLSSLRDLRTLCLAESEGVTSEGMISVAALYNLECLYLQRIHIGDKGMSHLVRLKKLKVLDLRGTGIDNNGLEHLKSLPSLEIVYVSPPPQLTQQGIDRIRAALPKVKIEPTKIPFEDEGILKPTAPR